MANCAHLYSYCRLLRNKSCERILYTGRQGSLRSSMLSFFLERVSIASVSIHADTVSPGIPIIASGIERASNHSDIPGITHTSNGMSDL